MNTFAKLVVSVILNMSHRELCATISVILLIVSSASSNKDGSLVLVIDNTPSMANDIKQLQEGFDSVMDDNLTRSSHIENVVLVTFNDPDWSCATREDQGDSHTTLLSKSSDRKTLKYAINSITTNGGGDCPEYSLSGILRGLEESNPNSYMFVFTDATPKDGELKEAVILKAQEKGTQIFFVLTPNRNEDEDRFDAYYDIAMATLGSVFRLQEKNEVRQILNFVSQSYNEKTVLLSKLIPGKTMESVNFTVDNKIEQLIVLVSGEKMNLTAEILNSEKITWLSNVKALKIKNPVRGDYHLKIGGRKRTSVLVYGVTHSTFEFGFFDEEPASMNGTKKTCVIGSQTHLAISSNDEKDTKIELVQITQPNGKLFREMTLRKIKDFYVTELFMPPNSTFLVRVQMNANGKSFMRNARTPIVPYLGPEIDQSSKAITANERILVVIKCRILKGLPKPNITWKFKSMKSDIPITLPERGESITIEKVDLTDAGEYTCEADNLIGVDHKTIELTVTAKPVVTIISDKRENMLDYNSDLTLSCKVKASPEPDILWTDSAGIEVPSHEVEKDGIFEYTRQLYIRNIKRPNEYKCEASNNLGKNVQKYNISVKLPFHKLNNTRDHNISVNYGDAVELPCDIEASVPINYNWFIKHGDEHVELKPTKNVTISPDGKHLTIKNALSINEFYECRASVIGDEDIFTKKTFNITTLGKAPQIDQSSLTIVAKEDSSVDIKCSITDGHPKPDVTWQFSSTKSAIPKELPDSGENITKKVVLDDAGFYTCKAENPFGVSHKTFELIVTAAPQISLENEAERLVGEGNPIKLCCRIDKGTPTPKMKWQFKPEHGEYYEDMTYKTEEIEVKDPKDGYYKCTATNDAGADEKTTHVELIYDTKA